jgi:hypothetical protein
MSTILEDIGLSLDEVSILDTCVLFSDGDLKAMDEGIKWRAVEAAYALVEKIIRILWPRIIIYCECATPGRRDHLENET